MRIDHLQHFMAVVEHGGLRAAARRLGLPQPALTRSIRALEKEAGVALFTRESTGMRLTVRGQRFATRAGRIVQEAKRLHEEVQIPQAEYEGEVSAALSIMPHLSLLPSALPMFRKAYPKVRLELREDLLPGVEADLRNGRVDFYLGAAPDQVPSADLAMHRLCDNHRVVVARRGHPLSGAKTLADLAGAQWATTAVDYNAEGDLMRVFASRNLPVPQVMCRAHSALSVLTAVAHSDWLVMLPSQWLDNPMPEQALQVLPLRESLAAPAIVWVHRSESPLTPPAEYLCDLLMRALPRGGSRTAT